MLKKSARWKISKFLPDVYEDGRGNPGSRPCTFKTQENPGSKPWTFDDREYQFWSRWTFEVNVSFTWDPLYILIAFSSYIYPHKWLKPDRSSKMNS